MLKPFTYSLLPLSGTLRKDNLLHLLRRSIFGVGHSELALFENKSIQECMTLLLTPNKAPTPPIQEDPDIIDQLVPNGQTWVNAPFAIDEIEKKRVISLKGWWMEQILKRDHSLTEKMTIFWHNHFVTETEIVKDSRYSYRYVEMLRRNALGNYKSLILEGTTNVAMLVYLNGNANTKAAPNENFGRELLELFTLGKSPDVRYTEDDVRAAAKTLSGWMDNKDTFLPEFYPELHDGSDKQFSAYFNNHIIHGKEGASGATETDELIELIFSKLETAKFLCLNLYRWFVSSTIDDEVEQKIILPLSNLLIENHFEVAPVLKTLLSSEHFFDPAFKGCIVKSPLDFFVGATKTFNIQFPDKHAESNLCSIHYFFNIGGLGLNIGDPPSVAGWPAFYQAPKFHQWWINSYTLGFRMKVAEGLLSDEGINCNGPKIKMDFVNFASKFDNPDDVDSILKQCTEMLFAVPLSPQVYKKLKNILLSGQSSATYWTKSWNAYTENPKSEMTESVVKSRLRLFFLTIMNMPEFQMT